MIIVPHQQLDEKTLEAVIEEFVSREGTEYGASEVSLGRKVEQVRKQLQSGRACLCFDQQTETCNILPKEEAEQLAGNGGNNDDAYA